MEPENSISDIDFSFDTTKKKKKKQIVEEDSFEINVEKKKKKVVEEDSEENPFEINIEKRKKKVFKEDSEENPFEINIEKRKRKKENINKITSNQSWQNGTEEDYIYEFLLKRLYSCMPQHKLQILHNSSKFRVPIPLVIFANKRTIIQNFGVISLNIKRPKDHIQNFFTSEMSIQHSSIDASGAFLMKCKLTQNQIEHLLRKYITKYVICLTCKSPDTNLLKREKIYFTQCNSCSSEISLAENRLIDKRE